MFSEDFPRTKGQLARLFAAGPWPPMLISGLSINGKKRNEYTNDMPANINSISLFDGVDENGWN